MRKNVLPLSPSETTLQPDGWLDLNEIARVEVTSEALGYPIEAALVPGAGSEWRAATSGRQTIRLRFDQPQKITRIRLQFDVSGQTRTQEFSLRCSSDEGASFQDIVRQQYNFSPPSTTHEEENFRVDLVGVTDLELAIVPDVSGGGACASLTEFRVS